MTETTDASGAKRGAMYIRYGEDEAPSRVLVTLGEDNDDRSGYAATAQGFTTFESALARLKALRETRPDACMRYMYNNPELDLPPYWEVDPNAAAMEARLCGSSPRRATFFALVQGGMSQEEALALSGVWRETPATGDTQ